MGVPLPHLVLPLSGCLSRRTPTRATRGEARGHRSVLAQNPLFMNPFFFIYLDLSSAWCVLAKWWNGPQCVGAAVAAFLPGVVRSHHFVDMWVAEGHTARWPWICVLFVHRLAVLVKTGAGHVHTVAMSGSWCTAGVNGVATLSGTMVLRGCVWDSRSSGPHWLPQSVGRLRG